MKVTEKILEGSIVKNKLTGEKFKVVRNTENGDGSRFLSLEPTEDREDSGDIIIVNKENAICYRCVKYAKPTEPLDAYVDNGSLTVHGKKVSLGELEGKVTHIGNTPTYAVIATDQGVYAYDYIKESLEQLYDIPDEEQLVGTETIDGAVFIKFADKIETEDDEKEPETRTTVRLFDPLYNNYSLKLVCQVTGTDEAEWSIVKVTGGTKGSFFVNMTADGKTESYDTNLGNGAAPSYSGMVYAVYSNRVIGAGAVYMDDGVIVNGVLFKADAKDLIQKGFTAVCDFDANRDDGLDVAFLCDADCRKSIQLSRKAIGDARGYDYEVKAI